MERFSRFVCTFGIFCGLMIAAGQAVGTDEVSPEITVEEVAEQATMSIRFQAAPTELGAKFGQSFGALYGYVMANGGEVVGPPFGRYYDTTAERFDVEVGLPVAKTLKTAGKIKPGQLPGGRVATLTYVGPDEKRRAAHQLLRDWVERHGEKTSGAMWESYVYRQKTRMDANENETKLFLLIESEKSGDSKEARNEN
jgi:effector-binding domain-containing protein